METRKNFPLADWPNGELRYSELPPTPGIERHLVEALVEVLDMALILSPWGPIAFRAVEVLAWYQDAQRQILEWHRDAQAAEAAADAGEAERERIARYLADL